MHCHGKNINNESIMEELKRNGSVYIFCPSQSLFFILHSPFSKTYNIKISYIPVVTETIVFNYLKFEYEIVRIKHHIQKQNEDFNNFLWMNFRGEIRRNKDGILSAPSFSYSNILSK